MARTPRTAGPGHNNAPLDDDEIAALQLWFSTKIREARKEADAAKAVLDSKREVVNGLFSQARADGFRAGMRGEIGEPPEHVSSVCHQDWMGGWTEGQAKLAEGMFKAEGILEKIKAGQPKPVELEPDEDLDQIDIEDGLDDAARKLKRSGWTEPTAEEASFQEEAA